MTNKHDRAYTETEIMDMFRNDETLDSDFRSEMLSRLNATYQAMYNCVHQREKTMRASDSHGDWWQEEHGRFVERYQRYHK